MLSINLLLDKISQTEKIVKRLLFHQNINAIIMRFDLVSIRWWSWSGALSHSSELRPPSKKCDGTKNTPRTKKLNSLSMFLQPALWNTKKQFTSWRLEAFEFFKRVKRFNLLKIAWKKLYFLGVFGVKKTSKNQHFISGLYVHLFNRVLSPIPPQWHTCDETSWKRS